jgi:hypothetical protein
MDNPYELSPLCILCLFGSFTVYNALNLPALSTVVEVRPVIPESEKKRILELSRLIAEEKDADNFSALVQQLSDLLDENCASVKKPTVPRHSA